MVSRKEERKEASSTLLFAFDFERLSFEVDEAGSTGWTDLVAYLSVCWGWDRYGRNWGRDHCRCNLGMNGIISRCFSWPVDKWLNLLLWRPWLINSMPHHSRSPVSKQRVKERGWWKRVTQSLTYSRSKGRKLCQFNFSNSIYILLFFYHIISTVKLNTKV